MSASLRPRRRSSSGRSMSGAGTTVAPGSSIKGGFEMTRTGDERSVWFVTGASRGFGLEIARQVLASGDALVATAREPRRVERSLGHNGGSLLAIALDVTDEAGVEAAAAEAVARFGRIDVLVNNAGRGLLGAVEEASGDEVRAIFDTNVFGLLTVTRAVLPVMR